MPIRNQIAPSEGGGYWWGDPSSGGTGGGTGAGGNYTPSQNYSPQWFPYGGEINPIDPATGKPRRDENAIWPGMDPDQFLSNPGYLDAPTGGALGAYSSLASSAPTAAELASYKALANVNPYAGVGAAGNAYSNLLNEEMAASGPEGWMIGKARELAENPGYSGAEKADISNATASAMTGQIGAAKDEMYRRAARSGNPMATYNAMATAGNKASDVMANAERANRINYADKAREDKYNVMSQIAPQAAALQLQRRTAGAAGTLGTAGQAFGQGTGYANMINQFANSQAARSATGAAGLAGLYGQDSQNLQNQYELLTKLMSQPVSTETAGAKQGG